MASRSPGQPVPRELRDPRVPPSEPLLQALDALIRALNDLLAADSPPPGDRARALDALRALPTSGARHEALSPRGLGPPWCQALHEAIGALEAAAAAEGAGAPWRRLDRQRCAQARERLKVFRVLIERWPLSANSPR